MALDTPAKRIKWAREHGSSFSKATEAAKELGWTVSTYLGHENGDRNPSRDAAKKYGAAYRVPWVWILEGGSLPGKDTPVARRAKDDQPETPIAHFVGAGDEVNLYDDAGSGMAIDYTPSPPGFERTRGAAAVVRGDSMRPIFDAGDLLFFRPPRPPPAAHDLPERAVIVQVRGKLFVKKLLPGTKPGRFHLLSINPLTPVMQDQPVQSYAFIEWVKPKVV